MICECNRVTSPPGLDRMSEVPPTAVVAPPQWGHPSSQPGGSSNAATSMLNASRIQRLQHSRRCRAAALAREPCLLRARTCSRYSKARLATCQAPPAVAPISWWRPHGSGKTPAVLSPHTQETADHAASGAPPAVSVQYARFISPEHLDAAPRVRCLRPRPSYGTVLAMSSPSSGTS